MDEGVARDRGSLEGVGRVPCPVRGAVGDGRLAWRVPLSRGRRQAGMQPACAMTPEHALARRSRLHVGTASTPSSRRCLQSEIDEDTAIRIALINNPIVAAEYERLGIARADLVQAGLLSNPVFDGDIKFFDECGGDRAQALTALLGPLLHSVANQGRPSRARRPEGGGTRNLVTVAFDVRRAFVTVRALSKPSSFGSRA